MFSKYVKGNAHRIFTLDHQFCFHSFLLVVTKKILGKQVDLLILSFLS